MDEEKYCVERYKKGVVVKRKNEKVMEMIGVFTIGDLYKILNGGDNHD